MSDDDVPTPADVPPGTPRDRVRTVLVVGAVLLVAGLVATAVLALRPVGFASFGWFAYLPVDGTASLPGVMVLRRELAWTVLATGVGAVLVRGAVGYRRGRRAADRGRALPR